MSKRLINKLLKYIVFAVLFAYFLNYIGLFLQFSELSYGKYFHYPLEGDVIQYANQIRSKQDVKVPPINNYSYIFINNQSQKCKNEGSIRLTFVIKSALTNDQHRAAIRRSWGFENRFSDVKIKRIFLLGISQNPELMRSIELEAVTNNDIVQANFIDNYFNNTIKTVLGLRWAAEHCPTSEHFMFVDDDYYVSVKNVLKFISNTLQQSDAYDTRKFKQNTIQSYNQTNKIPSERTLFAGFVFQTSPHRHKFSKWFVSLEEYPFDLWPPYVTAGAYILSRETLLNLYYTSLYTRHFRFDDVFLGIVSLKAKIKLTHCDDFHFYGLKFNGPESYRQVIASHGFNNPSFMENVWNQCRSAGYS